MDNIADSQSKKIPSTTSETELTAMQFSIPFWPVPYKKTYLSIKKKGNLLEATIG
jgi:hypothetical protein